MTEPKDLRWWTHERKYDAVIAIVEDIQARNGRRRSMDAHHLRLYADRINPWEPAFAGRRGSHAANYEPRPRLSINVVKNCIDSATSLITKSRPRATYLTDGLSERAWEMQMRAKKRGRFVDGIFHMNDAYALGQRAFKDACIFGTGIIKVCREHGRIRLEKTFPGELLVDDAEALYGEPRNFFQVKNIDKLVLKELFPKHKKAIDEAQPPAARFFGRGSVADQAQVVEAWHLPSGPDAKDGAHVIAVDGATLFEESYKHEAPPFAAVRWNEDTLGWHGIGIAQELMGIQYEINQLLNTVRENMYLGGNLKVLCPLGSNIVKSHINNQFGLILEYAGEAPTWIAPDTVSQQLLNHLQWLIEQAYAVTGLSQLGARSEIPAGLSGSGRSLLVYQNSESQRHIAVQRQYESLFLQLAERVLEAGADIEESGSRVQATYVGDGTVEHIGFKDIEGDADEYQIQVFPTSMLPQTPAGRLAMVEQLRAGQYIDQAQAKRMLDFPDISTEMDMDLAPAELIDERIGRILERGEYRPPHPRMDVVMALKRSTLAYQRAELRNAPPEALELLGQFIDECQDLIAQAEAEEAAMAAPAPTAGPVPPEGAPMGPMEPMPAEAGMMPEGMAA